MGWLLDVNDREKLGEEVEAAVTMEAKVPTTDNSETELLLLVLARGQGRHFVECFWFDLGNGLVLS